MKFFKLFLAGLLIHGMGSCSVAVAQTVGKQMQFNSAMGVDYETNLVKNPSAYINDLYKTTSSATATRDTDAGDQIDSKASWLIDSSAQNGYVEFELLTPSSEQTSGDCEYKGIYKGDASLYQAQILDGSNNVLNFVQLTSETGWREISNLTYPCGVSGIRKVRLVQTGSGNGAAFNFGRAFYGRYKVSSVSVKTPYRDFAGSITGTVSGTLNVGSGGSAQQTMEWAQDGEEILIRYRVRVGTSGATDVSGAYLFPLPSSITLNAITWDAVGYGDITVAASGAPLARLTAKYYASKILIDRSDASNLQSGDGLLFTNNNIVSIVIRAKVNEWKNLASAITPQIPRAPTYQRFTSGSGTYTTPVGATYIIVKMIGGGGGGGGSGTTGSGAGAGAAGGATSFGSSLISAPGGGAGNHFAIDGGGAASPGFGTVNSPAVTIRNSAGSRGSPVGSDAARSGGNGGASPLGGAGTPGVSATGSPTAGNAAIANSGSGGGGATASVASAWGGGGGASGAYVEARISNPATSYSYAVGAGGNGGPAGTSGAVGGAGGSGYIEVTEYYGSESVPVLTGNITSESGGAERVERARVGGSSATTNCTSNPCTIYSSSGAWATSVNWTSAGVMTINAKSGLWTSYPSCTCSAVDSVAGTVRSCWARANSTSSIDVYSFYTSNTSNGAVTNTNSYFDVICMGPR